MKLPRFLNVVAAMAALIAGAAQAEVIDFEDVPIGDYQQFTSQGFDFVLSNDAASIVNTQVCTPLCPVNGTHLLLAPYTNNLQISKSGASFDIAGFQGSGSFYIPPGSSFSGATHINVVGHLSGGGVVTQSFVINQTPVAGSLPLTSFLFNGSFRNLTSINFSSSGAVNNDAINGFALDNIVMAAPVPEPETYAMLLSGLGLAGLAARRKAKA